VQQLRLLLRGDMKLKIGDKVRVIRDCSDIAIINEPSGGLGMIGEVVSCDCGPFIKVKSEQFSNSCKSWLFRADEIELVDSDQRSSVHVIFSVCPRCNGEMVDKQTADYGVIKKCRDCGYC